MKPPLKRHLKNCFKCGGRSSLYKPCFVPLLNLRRGGQDMKPASEMLCEALQWPYLLLFSLEGFNIALIQKDDCGAIEGPCLRREPKKKI